MAATSTAPMPGAGIKLLRWTARVWSVLMFVLWGFDFLFDHMQWFARQREPLPPGVWTQMLLHLLMLVGLAIGWKFELVGGLIVLIAAPVFFFKTAGPYALMYTVLTIIPAVAWLACAAHSRLTGIPAQPTP